MSRRLPDFPWDTIADARQRASAHPDGLIDLSVGTPVDPTPAIIQQALAEASDSPGYPQTWGTAELRTAIADYHQRRWGSVGIPPTGILPVLGTKELVAGLPSELDLGPDDAIVIPRVAYPTYAVGAAMTGSPVVTADDPADLGSLRPALVWINSPANPSGWTQNAQQLRAWVDWARDRGAVLASDECYAEFGWEAEPASVLQPAINGGTLDGVLALHSLSKRSNLAGYRAGWVAGDPKLVQPLLEVRKHLGRIVPGPVQRAMVAAVSDSEHVTVQRQRYAARRARLRPALAAAGFRVEHSEAGLYLWSTRDEDGRRSVDWLADRGILAAPGDFYGPSGARHLRIALTATDERIAAAASRLGSAPVGDHAGSR